MGNSSVARDPIDYHDVGFAIRKAKAARVLLASGGPRRRRGGLPQESAPEQAHAQVIGATAKAGA
jgi:hypothetical protein